MNRTQKVEAKRLTGATGGSEIFKLNSGFKIRIIKKRIIYSFYALITEHGNHENTGTLRRGVLQKLLTHRVDV